MITSAHISPRQVRTATPTLLVEISSCSRRRGDRRVHACFKV